MESSHKILVKKKIQHVGVGQQESHAAYRWSNGMEKFSTGTLCSVGSHIHTITLTNKVLSFAAYYSNQSSLNAAICNLFNKRWDMQNGMCQCFQWPQIPLLPFTCGCHQLQLQSETGPCIVKVQLVWLSYCFCWDYDGICLNTITQTHKEGTHSMD